MVSAENLFEELTDRLRREYLPMDLLVHEKAEITWNSLDKALVYVWGVMGDKLFYSHRARKVGPNSNPTFFLEHPPKTIDLEAVAKYELIK